jgi:UDP-N-acetylglucosamine/UDP-N-acetylgalactosamine diphosphorylase
MKKEELVELLRPYGQEHLVKFWDELNGAEREILLNEIITMDFVELNATFKRVKAEMNEENKQIDGLMAPVANELKCSYTKSSKTELERYESTGYEAIANGEVAVVLLAGGQGTRLGVTYPKGMYSVDLLSKKTLFQIQAERLLKVKELASLKNQHNKSASLPWYIMTSAPTYESTVEYFRKNNYFGLSSSDIIFFEQGTSPCFNYDGRIILDRKNKISRAPDGNGGLYKALLKEGILDDMAQKGIKYVHIYCVDNILVKMADPIFTGFCIAKQANCGSKVRFFKTMVSIMRLFLISFSNKRRL